MRLLFYTPQRTQNNQVGGKRDGNDGKPIKFSQICGGEWVRSTTCLLQLLDAVTKDHEIMAATNLIEDVDVAVKRRFPIIHKMHRLNIVENEKFIKQYLYDAGFVYDEDSIKAYASGNYLQAEIMNHITRSIAESLIQKRETVIL